MPTYAEKESQLHGSPITHPRFPPCTSDLQLGKTSTAPRIDASRHTGFAVANQTPGKLPQQPTAHSCPRKSLHHAFSITNRGGIGACLAILDWHQPQIIFQIPCRPTSCNTAKSLRFKQLRFIPPIDVVHVRPNRRAIIFPGVWAIPTASYLLLLSFQIPSISARGF